jgi:hypothetical protein
VEQTSNLTGATWTTSALYLRTGGDCGSQLIRRVSSTDSEYHHADPRGNFGVISSSTATVLSNNLYDYFGVTRYTSGMSQSPWLSDAIYIEADGLQVASIQQRMAIPTRALVATPLDISPDCVQQSYDEASCKKCCQFMLHWNLDNCKADYRQCMQKYNDPTMCNALKRACDHDQNAKEQICEVACRRHYRYGQ